MRLKRENVIDVDGNKISSKNINKKCILKKDCTCKK